MTHWSATRRSFLRNTLALAIAAGSYGCRSVGRSRLHLSRARERIGNEDAHVVIEYSTLIIDGREAEVTALNASVPGPLVRLREGDDAVLSVTNLLDEDSSIHWHGLLLPAGMDGVPGVSYAGIQPGETFTHRFPVRQSGTYWYHSHSGLQEQTGVFGPLIIDPASSDPYEYDLDYVITLSDWTFEDPHKILARLKKQSGYYNFQKRTLGDLIHDASQDGLGNALADRMEWAKMRMDPTDIADITGHTYTYLLNGLSPADNWTGLFRPGDRIRLRFINAAAASYFDVHIPGLEMTVVQADGQNVEPVTVDEFRIAIAETLDVIVQPTVDSAFTVFAEAMDRSGYARGTLAPMAGMQAEVPTRRPRPLLTMADMGMGGMGGMGDMNEMPGMDHGTQRPPEMPSEHDLHGRPDMEAMPSMSEDPGDGVKHGPDHHGPGNSMVAMMSKSRLHEPGVGLEDAGHRVLVYGDLRSLDRNVDERAPAREIELHLTGNMERYMWSFDGKKFSEVDGPILFEYGERLRLTLVNDTMMNHPIHLHGMWMELDVGAGIYNPRKHTVNVKPAERLSVNITADAPGNWAFHCHILYHMEMGMFRVVSVVGAGSEKVYDGGA